MCSRLCYVYGKEGCSYNYCGQSICFPSGPFWEGTNQGILGVLAVKMPRGAHGAQSLPRWMLLVWYSQTKNYQGQKLAQVVFFFDNFFLGHFFPPLVH